MEKITVAFRLNGKDVSVTTDPNKRLVDFLREDCGCLSVKEGCGEGECGACTIIWNGEAVTSCLMLAGQIAGDEIITTEGLLKDDGALNTLQQAFVDSGAIQCGFCTPGMLMSATALLMKNPKPTRDEIRRAISGNLCRCTGYAKIVDAVEIAANAERNG